MVERKKGVSLYDRLREALDEEEAAAAAGASDSESEGSEDDSK